MTTYTLILTKQGRNYRITKKNSVGGCSGGDTARNLVGALWTAFMRQADEYPIRTVVVNGEPMPKPEVLALLSGMPSGASAAYAKANVMLD